MLLSLATTCNMSKATIYGSWPRSVLSLPCITNSSLFFVFDRTSHVVPANRRPVFTGPRCSVILFITLHNANRKCALFGKALTKSKLKVLIVARPAMLAGAILSWPPHTLDNVTSDDGVITSTSANMLAVERLQCMGHLFVPSCIHTSPASLLSSLSPPTQRLFVASLCRFLGGEYIARPTHFRSHVSRFLAICLSRPLSYLLHTSIVHQEAVGLPL